jgi:hypothetical protein
MTPLWIGEPSALQALFEALPTIARSAKRSDRRQRMLYINTAMIEAMSQPKHRLPMLDRRMDLSIFMPLFDWCGAGAITIAGDGRIAGVRDVRGTLEENHCIVTHTSSFPQLIGIITFFMKYRE